MGLAIPKPSSLNRKLDELHELVNYRLNNDEITAMVEKKNQLRKKYDPEMRENLDRALREAREKGNTLLANQLQEELDALGKPAGLAFRTTLTPTKPSPAPNSTQQDRLAELNRENRRRNIEAVRKAQLKERQRAREIEKKIARGEEVEEDVSRRLKTKAKFVYDVNESTSKKSGSAAGSGASTPANGTP
jgi:RNA polymerase-associated protein RTF1